MIKTMSKFKYLLLIALFAVATIFAFGCKDVKVTGISVDDNGYNATAYLNSDYDFSVIKIIVSLENGKKETKSCKSEWVYENGEVVSSDFTQTPGEHEFEVRYKGFSDTVTILVLNEEDPEKDKPYQIDYFTDPQFVLDFRQNTTGASAKVNMVETQDDLLDGKKVGFNDLSATYVVGDDNAFVYTPIMKDNENHTLVTIENFRTSTVIYLKNDQEVGS